jgi:hypothetical protein
MIHHEPYISLRVIQVSFLHEVPCPFSDVRMLVNKISKHLIVYEHAPMTMALIISEG